MEFTKTTQDSLFGEEVMLESLFAERAKVLDEALKILQRDQNTFANLVRKEKTIAEGGNKLGTESNKQRAETNGQAKQIIQTLSSRTGDISSALSAAAKRFKETGKAAPAARDFAEFVRGGIERGDFAGVSVEPPIRTFEPPAQNDRLAAGPAAEQIDAFSTPPGPKADAALDRLENEFVETLSEVGELDAAAQADLLDSLVPTGRVVDGEAERVTARSLFEEIESDKSMLNRLKDCV